MTKRTSALGILLLLLIAAMFLLYRSMQYHGGSQATESASSTLERIFNDVTTDLGVRPDDIAFFSVYGDDRVTYNTRDGVTFAYKSESSWHFAGPRSSQEQPLCSLLNAVPEQYRQSCYEPSTGQSRYADADGQNANYPYKEGIRYR